MDEYNEQMKCGVAPNCGSYYLEEFLHKSIIPLSLTCHVENKELHNLYSSPSIIKKIKSRAMR
jgi:hypothetical protein